MANDPTTPDRAIEAVIWDFGGVFTSSPFHAIATHADELGVDVKVIAALIFGDYGADTDHPWHRLERGEISFEQAGELIDAEAIAQGVDLTLQQAMGAIAGAGGAGVCADMPELVREVRASGLRTGLLTNNLVEIRDLWRPLLPLDELFDDVVDSSEVGLRKPDPAIYLLACGRLGGVDPEAVIFLDDAESNVEAAREVGMIGLVVTYGDPHVRDEVRSLIAH